MDEVTKKFEALNMSEQTDTEAMIEFVVNTFSVKSYRAIFLSLINGTESMKDIERLAEVANRRTFLYELPEFGICYHNRRMCCHIEEAAYCPLDYFGDDVHIEYEVPDKCGVTNSHVIAKYNEIMAELKIPRVIECTLKNNMKQKVGNEVDISKYMQYLNKPDGQASTPFTSPQTYLPQTSDEFYWKIVQDVCKKRDMNKSNFQAPPLFATLDANTQKILRDETKKAMQLYFEQEMAGLETYQCALLLPNVSLKTSHGSNNIHNPTASTEMNNGFSMMGELTEYGNELDKFYGHAVRCNVLPTSSPRPVMPEHTPIPVDSVFKAVNGVIEESRSKRRNRPSILVDFLLEYFKPEMKCAYFIKNSVAKEIVHTARKMLEKVIPEEIDWEREVDRTTTTYEAMVGSMTTNETQLIRIMEIAEWRAILHEFPALAIFYHNQQMCCSTGPLAYCPLDYLDDNVKVEYELPKKCGFTSSASIKEFRRRMKISSLHNCPVTRNQLEREIGKLDKKDSSVQVTLDTPAEKKLQDKADYLYDRLADLKTKIVELEESQSTSEDTIAQLRKQLEELQISHKKELNQEKENYKGNKKLLEELTRTHETLEKDVIEKNKKWEKTVKGHKEAVERFNRQKKDDEDNAKKQKDLFEKTMKDQKELAENQMKKQKELLSLANSQKKEKETYASRQKKLADEQKELAEKEVKKREELEEKLERQKKAYEENAIRQKKLAEKALKDQKEMAERESKKQKEINDKALEHQIQLVEEWKERCEKAMDKDVPSTSAAGDIRSRYSVNDYVTYINEGGVRIQTAQQKLAEFLANTNVTRDRKMAQTEYDNFEMTMQFYLSKAQRNYKVLTNNKEAENYELINMEFVEPKVFSELIYAKMEAAREIDEEIEDENIIGNEEENEIGDENCYICYEKLEGIRLYQCPHCYKLVHRHCIGNWEEIEATCPCCRGSVLFEEDYPYLGR